jgi:hypothetical protein
MKAYQKLSNKEKAWFHYYSMDGLLEQKRICDRAITDLVDDSNGTIPNGAIIAYGSLNVFYENQLRELLTKNRVNPYFLESILEGLQRDIDQAKKFINQAN